MAIMTLSAEPYYSGTIGTSPIILLLNDTLNIGAYCYTRDRDLCTFQVSVQNDSLLLTVIDRDADDEVLEQFTLKKSGTLLQGTWSKVGWADKYDVTLQEISNEEFSGAAESSEQESAESDGITITLETPLILSKKMSDTDNSGVCSRTASVTYSNLDRTTGKEFDFWEQIDRAQIQSFDSLITAMLQKSLDEKWGWFPEQNGIHDPKGQLEWWSRTTEYLESSVRKTFADDPQGSFQRLFHPQSAEKFLDIFECNESGVILSKYPIWSGISLPCSMMAIIAPFVQISLTWDQLEPYLKSESILKKEIDRRKNLKKK